MINKYKFLLIITTLGFYCANAQQKSALSDKNIEKLMQQHQVPALGVGIIKKGKLKEVKVYGELKKDSPAPTDAVFNVASLTKPLVAVLTLQLVSKGEWNLDEPLAKYWVDPDVADDKRHKELTTRHILSHQTGFLNWRWSHRTKKLAFDFDPGKRFSYSGEGFEYLRRALEKKFNTSIEQLADSLIFKPLQMKNTRFIWDKNMQDEKFAVGHDGAGNPYNVKKETEANAADDLLTTVEDYSKFAIATMKRFGMSRSVFSEMIQPQAQVNEHAHRGLGWELYPKLSGGEYALMHNGSDSGTRCLVIILPKSKQGIVIMTNSDSGEALFNKLVSESLDQGKELMEKSKK